MESGKLVVVSTVLTFIIVIVEFLIFENDRNHFIAQAQVSQSAPRLEGFGIYSWFLLSGSGYC